MKLQLSYEIMFGYVQKLQIAHLEIAVHWTPLKTINGGSYNKFYQPRPGRFLGLRNIFVHSTLQTYQVL